MKQRDKPGIDGDNGKKDNAKQKEEDEDKLKGREQITIREQG